MSAGRQIALSLKRAFDLFVAATNLTLLSPLIVLAAVAIKLDNRGPVFYAQNRVGRNGKVFRCFKFRTMVVGAENEGLGLEVAQDDDRITRVGQLLRNWTFDEVPQLFNVLKGDMSIVGPRPTVPEQVARYTARDRRRLETRPGMAGWAWIHGRNSIPWRERIDLDIWYVDNWSLALDARILWKSGVLLLRRKGVYGADGVARDFE